MTIVFSDLSGSTDIGERLDPESMRAVMARYFAEMRQAIERHGGTVEKFIGDAVMAVFGIPSLHEDDAMRAVRAAQEMRERLETLNHELERRWRVRLHVRTGINTGEVVTGNPSAGYAFATGDAVNVAARLEQAAKPQEILLGGETHRLVRDGVRVEELEPLVLKGKSHRVAAFRLLALTSDESGVSRRLSTAQVGREDELAILDDALTKAVEDNTSRTVTVLGEAGVGKSHLVRAFASRLGERATVLSGRCLPYGEGITFWPLAEVVRDAAGIAHQDDADRGLAKLAALLGPAAESEAAVAALGEAIGLVEEPTDPATILWALRRFLQAIAEERPLVVVLEDVHWAEETFLDLIDQLAVPVEGAFLIVRLARPELPSERLLPSVGAAVTLNLAPLNDEQTLRLVSELLDGSELAPEISTRVGPAAGGNPLYVEELLHKLIDDGVLKRESDVWRCAGDFSPESVPPTLRALLAARLERLEDAQRSVIERAAVAGEEFWPSAVALFPPEIPSETLRAALDGLLAKALLRPGGRRFAGQDAYRFAHLLVRDVAYDGLLKESRAEMHERMAVWLEESARERVAEYEEILGYHFERALRYREELGPLDARGRELARRAADHLSRAGRRALARSDMPAAVSLLERSYALFAPDDAARHDVSLSLGIALTETGQVSRAEALIDERIAVARRGRAYLTYRDGDGRRRVFDLDERGPRVTIGRRAGNDVSLGWDTDVSRIHAALQEEEGRWALVDEGLSRNGSYVNGQRVSGRRPLRDGDVLRIGATVLVHHAPVTAKTPTAFDQSGVTTLGASTAGGLALSSDERRVLMALANHRAEEPLAVEEVAAELLLSASEVVRLIESLTRFFAVEGEPGERRRRVMIERALAAGLISQAEVDPRPPR